MREADAGMGRKPEKKNAGAFGHGVFGIGRGERI